MKAIDTVLEKIAPSSEAAWKKNTSSYRTRKKKKPNYLVAWPKHWALNETPNWKAKIQLLSTFCGKDADDQYVYKQNELLIHLKEKHWMMLKEQDNMQLKPHLVCLKNQGSFAITDWQMHK